MKKQVSEYEQRAIDFATKHNVTAVFAVTLERPNKKPFSFDFSTSINDSYYYTEQGKSFIKRQGLPPRLDSSKWFANGRSSTVGVYTIHETKKALHCTTFLLALQKTTLIHLRICNHNTGDYNTGDYNTGHYNTGDYNTGHYNTGDYNTGNGWTGSLNFGEAPFYLFNKIADKSKVDFSLVRKLYELLLQPEPIEPTPFLTLPNATKKKIKALHKATLKAMDIK